MYNKAEKAALSLISRAEQNSLGLRFKLERKGYDAALVQEVINRLTEKNLLNDERFAELWIRSCLARKRPSPLWLRVSLEKRGINSELALRAIKKVLDDETEYALLLKYIEKMDISREKEPGYFKNQLKFEGFSYEIINKYFDSI